jgi:F0F1-type ATP synthase membrane subunit a
MNSYVVPVSGHIDPTNYQDRQYRLQKDVAWLHLVPNFDKKLDGWLEQGLRLHWMSSYNGMILMFAFLIIMGVVLRYRKDSSFSLLFVSMFEGIWDLFEDLLWQDKPLWMKQYVVYTFFVILLSNLFGIINDIIRFVVPRWLRNVTNPTGEFEFAIWLALIATIIPLVLQIKALWPLKFFHEYVPITGKGLIEWKWFWQKIGDIVISLFTWFLDIVGIFSKIVSLSMRLFGNMSSGSILLNVMFLWIGWLTAWLTAMNLVVGLPLIVYIQWLLAAVVQAFVFAMLTSIGIKLAIE